MVRRLYCTFRIWNSAYSPSASAEPPEPALSAARDASGDALQVTERPLMLSIRQRRAVIADALSTLQQNAPHQTDGIWLEELTAEVAALLADWDVDGCWRWSDWPDRDHVMPAGTPDRDVGIDAVARGRSDGRWIAIQAKSRKLDADGRGDPVDAGELDKFLSAASDASIWSERWLVVNGAVALGGYSPGKVAMSGAPVKVQNLRAAVVRQRDVIDESVDSCGHCLSPDDPDALRTRSCMQAEAVEASVELLREHAHSNSGGLPFGQARGRLILPCGTGKTRIALQIVEQLTLPNQVSVVLCPSIALVAQIRREFLEHASRPLRALAVCSDETAGWDAEEVAGHRKLLHEEPHVRGLGYGQFADASDDDSPPGGSPNLQWMTAPSGRPSAPSAGVA